MQVHINHLESTLDTDDGDGGAQPALVERVVEIVLARLEARERERTRRERASRVVTSVVPAEPWAQR